MRFETFNKKCTEVGLEAKECSPYHWQIRGGKFLINFYHTRNKIYVGQTAHSVYGDYNKAIKCANDLPHKEIENEDRRHTGHYQRAKKKLMRAGSICHICKKEVNKGEGSIDHLIPLSKGGLNNMNNYALAHIKCNNDKGNQILL